MDWWVIGLLLTVAFLFLLLSGVPVAFSLGFLSIAGMFWLWGGTKGLSLLGGLSFGTVASFVFVALPLFILMAEALFFTGIADTGMKVLDNWLGFLPGGLGVTCCAAGAIFGAASGSSMASTAAIGKVVIPEMLSRGYDKRLAAGAVTGGAAIDVLIPPSSLAVLAAVVAGVPVSKLLFAGILPGLLIGGLEAAIIISWVLLMPGKAPIRKHATWGERWRGLVKLIPLIFLIVLVLGVMWFGIATATEAAALGALGALVMALVYRQLTWPRLLQALLGTAKISSMIFFIIVAATAFANLLAYLQIPRLLTEFVVSLNISPWMVLAAIQVVVLAMGCFLDAASIMFIIFPITLPIIRAFGFDPLWYALLILINIELGLLTPPFGMNAYVTKSVCPRNISLNDVFIGCIPFMAMHALGLFMVMLFPQLGLWLPSLMKGT